MNKELIVSRYMEDINWVYKVDKTVDSIVIYNKGAEIKSKSSRVKVCQLKNVGREAHSYIYHFIENRDNLAKITFTAQGDPFEHSPDFIKRLSVDYSDLHSLSIRYKKDWPSAQIVEKDKVVEYKGFSSRYGDMRYFGHRDTKETMDWFEKLWRIMFTSPSPTQYYYGYSAMWAIPKENILCRTPKFWSYFYDLLSHQYSTEAYSCSVDAWAFEAMWNAILTPENEAIF